MKFDFAYVLNKGLSGFGTLVPSPSCKEEKKNTTSKLKLGVLFKDVKKNTKKSRIWETKNLSTDADSRTDTILKRLQGRGGGMGVRPIRGRELIM